MISLAALWLLVVLTLTGAPKGPRAKPEPHMRPTHPRPTGQGPSTAEEMVAVAAEVCSWRGVGDCDPV